MSESVDTKNHVTGDIITPGSHEGVIQTLLIWLSQPNDREERRFLEAHPELLTQEGECILNDLILQGFQGNAQSLRHHLKLLCDARVRGSSVAAIRESAQEH